MTMKTKYHIKNSDGIYEVVYFQTSADQVITSKDLQFVTQEEKDMLHQVTKPTHYVHNQIVTSNVWEINHNLDKYPSVSITDSAGSIVIGEVLYIDSNNLKVSFSSGFAGTAYLN